MSARRTGARGRTGCIVAAPAARAERAAAASPICWSTNISPCAAPTTAFHQRNDPRAAFRLLSGLSTRLEGSGLAGLDGERRLVGNMLQRASLLCRLCGRDAAHRAPPLGGRDLAGPPCRGHRGHRQRRHHGLLRGSRAHHHPPPIRAAARRPRRARHIRSTRRRSSSRFRSGVRLSGQGRQHDPGRRQRHGAALSDPDGHGRNALTPLATITE